MSAYPPNVKHSIYYSLQYVLQQSPEFQLQYAEDWLTGCTKDAYPGQGDKISCVGGIFERFIHSLANTCVLHEEMEECQTLKDIVGANPYVLIPEYILDWYKLHKTGGENEFPKEMSNEEKKNNLKAFLLEKFPNEEAKINAKIEETEMGVGFDEDSFQYGGRRKTKRRRRKRGKTKRRKWKTVTRRKKGKRSRRMKR